MRVPELRPGDNMFSEEQEERLGDIVADQLQLSALIIEDPAVTGYLQTVDERLQATVPSSRVRFRFAVMDLGVTNAFSLPGGRIYLSRKIVGLLRSEDELAWLLAHEMGHALAHQAAIRFTRSFRRLLHVTRVETSELFDKWNELVETRKRNAGSADEDDEQEVADGISLDLVRAGGYDVQAGAAFFDRLAGLKGKTGSAFSDFLGSTPPNAKRLRELLRGDSRAQDARPQASIASSATFEKWRDEVLRYKGIGHRESLPGLVQRRKLEPALRPELAVLRFSPDGRYVLAQDESSIELLSRETLSPLFQIDADGASPAQFSSDSQRVSFLITPLFGSPRVEVWSIADRDSQIHEVYITGGCLSSLLSPEGDRLLCLSKGVSYSDNFPVDLRIIEVETGRVILERKPLALIGAVDLVDANGAPVIIARFSPDGRHLLLGGEAVAADFDLVAGQAVPLEAGVKRLMRAAFVFLGDGRVAGKVGQELHVVSFPDGRPLFGPLHVGAGVPTAVTRGDYVLLRPIKNGAVGVLDLQHQSIPLVLPGLAADVFGDAYIRERQDGKLALNSVSDGKEIRSAPLLDTDLGRLQDGAVSPDRRWIAASGRTRAGVWDLTTGQRVLHLRAFESAWLGERDALHAVLREKDLPLRSLVRFDLSAPPAFRAREGEPRVSWSQVGRFLVAVRAAKPEERWRNVTLEVKDITTDAVLWRRPFAKDTGNRLFDASTAFLVLVWSPSQPADREVLTNDPEWRDALSAAKDRKWVVCLEVIEAATGRVRGRVAIDGGQAALSLARVVATGDRLFIQEAGSGRVLAYSFDGVVRARTLARHFVVSPDGRRLVALTGQGRLAVLDGQTLAPMTHLDFPTRVSFVTFTPDGNGLTVLGADQTVYTFDLPASGAPTR